MPDDSSENSDKIEKIYRIIEFEINNANNQISLSKKDNVNFILLAFALIGFFAFIPADTFFYQWFTNGIYMMAILMGVIGITIVIYYFFDKDNVTNFSDDDKCELCDSSTICKNIDDKTRKEIWNFTDSLLIDNISLFYLAIIYTSFFFFVSCTIPYFYYTASKDITPLFQNNSLISFFLMVILIVYIIIYFRHPALIKKGNFKNYLLEMALYSIVIIFFTVLIGIYGFLSKIPPFIPITNVSQFSPQLIEHLKIIPSVPLSWVVTLYTLVITLVLAEHFFSSKYVESVNRKLDELLILKYRIDRYQLGISPKLNVENVQKTLSKQKIHPPNYFTIGGVISIPIPLSYDRCEEIFYSALEAQLVGDTEPLHK